MRLGLPLPQPRVGISLLPGLFPSGPNCLLSLSTTWGSRLVLLPGLRHSGFCYPLGWPEPCTLKLKFSSP